MLLPVLSLLGNITSDYIDYYHTSCDDSFTMLKPFVLIVDDDQSFFSDRRKYAPEGLFRDETSDSEKAFHENYTLSEFDLIIQKDRREGRQ